MTLKNNNKKEKRKKKTHKRNAHASSDRSDSLPHTHAHSLTQTHTMDWAAGPLSPTLNTQVSPQHRKCVRLCVWICDMWGACKVHPRCIPREDMRAEDTRKCVACVIKVHFVPVRGSDINVFMYKLRETFTWWMRPKWVPRVGFLTLLMKCSLLYWCLYCVQFISVLGHLQVAQITLRIGFNPFRATEGLTCSDRNNHNVNSLCHREVHKWDCFHWETSHDAEIWYLKCYLTEIVKAT